MKELLFTLLIFLPVCLIAQIEDSESANFLVEFEKFQPPTQEMIKSFEGSAPMQFLAPDIEGEEQFLGNYKGETVFIYFFNRDCITCTEQISSLNLLQNELQGKLKIIAFGDESKEDLKSFKDEQGIEYTLMYNGKLLGEAAYGIELGYPRLFVVDKEGITRHVIPSEAFTDSSKTYVQLKNLYDLVNSK